MCPFYYFDSTEVKVGDQVIGPEGRMGRVDEIIEPGTPESKSYSCPDGGVFFTFDWDGIESTELMTPPDGECWEDVEFKCRKRGQEEGIDIGSTNKQ